ncbi:MAG: hypothetical protein AAFZ15_00970 [Bacteroidota bacterium]
MSTKRKQSDHLPASTLLPKKSSVKQAVTFQSRLGYNKLYDPRNDRYLALPENFIAQPVVPGKYIGGSMDGNIYLEITEMPNNVEGIPESYCHEDAGLLLSAKKDETRLTAESTGRFFTGKLHAQPVTAYLILLRISADVNYLITLATKMAYPDLDLKELARMTVSKLMG